MRTLSLRTVLLGGNVVLVVAAVVLIADTATGLLRRFADQQAAARTELAAASALRILDRTRDDVSGSARLLSDRPTLARLIREDDRTAAEAFLERFRVAGGLSGCAALVDGRVFARSTGELPWDAIVSASRGTAGAFVISDTGSLVLGADWPLPGVPGAVAVAARTADRELERAVSAQVGLAVLVRGRDAAVGAQGEEAARVPLRARAIDAESPAVERLDSAGQYVACVPLRAPDGAIAGLVETALSTAEAAEPVRRLTRSLLLAAVGAGGLAAAFSVLIGRRLVARLEALTEASGRIGRGDLETPIPRDAPGEVGTLAESMDEMRRRLLGLTVELRGRQAQAEAILGGIVEGVFAVDRERRVRYVNPQAAALLGAPVDEIVGRFCGDVLRPRDDGGGRPCEDRCPILHARFRGSTRAVERLGLADGGERTVVITSAPPDADGGEQFQVLRDETEVEAARRLRDTVLANISHEFRTPLSAQLASIELLRDRLPDLAPQEVGELILSLQRGALRLTQLIDNLLESVRIESGNDSIRLRAVALDEVVEEAVELTSPLATLRDQRIELDLPYPLPAVMGDAPRLVQVFVNLLANAVKFAPSGSLIGVGGEVAPAEVILWVDDRGRGLPPGIETARFEPFLRSPGGEPEESGMGLGLWIVKSIVERHRGRIEMRSRPGSEAGAEGTRVVVILPRGGTDEDPGR